MKEKKYNSKVLHILFPILFVIILILIVVGGTYAYFQARSEDDGIRGGTATAPDLELTINKLSISAVANLIPLDNDVDSLTAAAKGYNFSGTTFDNTRSCIDKNGYSVCQVYEVKIKNNSTASVVLNGGVTKLEGKDTPNVACAVMDSNISVTNNSSCLSNTAFANNVKFNSGDEKTYYMLVYINNLHVEQYDKGDFFGTVVFSGTNGGVTAEFE